MKVYLIDRATNETKSTYENVESWGFDFVEYLNNGYRAKIYCDTQVEYFSDVEMEVVE